MNREIQATIEEVYRTFSHLPTPTEIEGCKCCWDESQRRPLLQTPLRKITAKMLEKYSRSAFHTAEGDGVYDYFLPRILELNAHSPGTVFCHETMALNIRAAGIRDWPAPMRDAVHSYFEALLEAPETKEASYKFDGVFCAMGIIGTDLTPYLERIIKEPELLILFYEHNADDLLYDRLASRFWDAAPEKSRQVLTWFDSQETRTAINSAYRR